MQSLIGIIFCFREHLIALSANIEAMFLQVAVPSDAYNFSGEKIQSRGWKSTSIHNTDQQNVDRSTKFLKTFEAEPQLLD